MHNDTTTTSALLSLSLVSRFSRMNDHELNRYRSITRRVVAEDDLRVTDVSTSAELFLTSPCDVLDLARGELVPSLSPLSHGEPTPSILIAYRNLAFSEVFTLIGQKLSIVVFCFRVFCILLKKCSSYFIV